MSSYRIQVFFLICGITLLVFSCKKDPQQPLIIDKSYFPLQTGRYIIYDVDSIHYNNFFSYTDPRYFTQAIYQIKEEVDSPYIDNTGDTAYKIIRSRRDDDSQPWVVTDIWSANLTDHTAEKVEENLRFVKLDFPVMLGKQWYGNMFVETDSPFEWLDGWKYEYTTVNQSLTLGGIAFDSTLTVTQQDDENVIEQTIFIEKYAKNVGMIYKFEEHMETQPTDDPNGYIIEMTVNDFK